MQFNLLNSEKTIVVIKVSCHKINNVTCGKDSMCNSATKRNKQVYLQHKHITIKFEYIQQKFNFSTIIFIYLPSDVISQEKNCNFLQVYHQSIKICNSFKTNTQTCRVKAIFSHLVRRQRRTKRSSKSTTTSPS